MGVAFVLFIGLAFGALDQALKIPEEIYLLGLVFFVYTIGLSSGSVFLESIRKRGLKANALVIAGLLAAFGLAAASHYLFSMKDQLCGRFIQRGNNQYPGTGCCY